MNEMAIIMIIEYSDTDVFAASTKWNFLNFKPGLVGGHCIGVDPYYLVHKARELGVEAEIITAGRKINDNMSDFIAKKAIQEIEALSQTPNSAKVLILGATFKENCPDIRNSKVFNLRQHLCEFGYEVFIYDPFADSSECKKEYNIELNELERAKCDCVIYAVPQKILEMDQAELFSNLKDGGILTTSNLS